MTKIRTRALACVALLLLVPVLIQPGKAIKSGDNLWYEYYGNHKIDYIGLDTTKQGEFETHYANLASAVHSNGTDMKEALMSSDNIYVELFPGEKVKLDFTLPKSKEDQRDFMIIIEGHYFTIS